MPTPPVLLPAIPSAALRLPPFVHRRRAPFRAVARPRAIPVSVQKIVSMVSHFRAPHWPRARRCGIVGARRRRVDIDRAPVFITADGASAGSMGTAGLR
jgi:hypothetical protein